MTHHVHVSPPPRFLPARWRPSMHSRTSHVCALSPLTDAPAPHSSIDDTGERWRRSPLHGNGARALRTTHYYRHYHHHYCRYYYYYYYQHHRRRYRRRQRVSPNREVHTPHTLRHCPCVCVARVRMRRAGETRDRDDESTWWWDKDTLAGRVSDKDGVRALWRERERCVRAAQQREKERQS